MTRVEELTLHFADGAASEAEVAELAALIAADTAARRACLELLELEAALRGDRAVDLVAVTMARLQSVLDDRVVLGVMERLPNLPATTTESPRVLRVNFSRTARRLAWAACFVLAALGGWLLWPDPAARVAEVAGDVRVARGQKTFSAQAGFKLKTGDWLLTGSNGTAAVSFPGETTRVAVGTNAELGLVSTVPGKQLRFLAGTLRASVARQSASHPMLLRTPTARAEVLGTKFELSATALTTRLRVEEGRVLFAGTNDESGVVIEAAQSGVVTGDAPVSVLAPPPAQTLAYALLAHWKFEGDGADTSGLSNSLKLDAGVIFTNGRLGRALDLRAAMVDVESPRLVLPPVFTLALWLNLNQGGPARTQPLLGFDGRHVGMDDFFLSLNPTFPGSSVTLNVRGRQMGSQALSQRGVIAVGRWQHVAVVVDGTQGRVAFHVDGREVTEQAGLRPGFRLAGPLLIGRRVKGGPQPFDGQLDEVRVYGRALSTLEITALAEGKEEAR